MPAKNPPIRIFNETDLVPGWLVGRLPPGQASLSVVLKGTFKMNPGGVAETSEPPDQLEGDVPEPDADLAFRYAADIVPFKPRVDLLFTGTAWAPGGRPVSVLTVTAEVGPWKKSLIIVGSSRMGKGILRGISSPEEFVSQPLGWRHAYGGAGYEMNPVGIGRDAQEDQGHSFIPLPRILRVDEVSKSVNELKEPAGFGPISSVWPQRMDIARKADYGAAWLADTWPGFPRDFDMSYFNAAPPDQQLPAGSLLGNETVVLTNLHPHHPVYRSELPGLRPRWFVREESDGGEAFHEIALTLDTLWVDTDNEKLVLLWRGLIPIRTKRMREVREHFIAVERLADSKKTQPEYRQELSRCVEALEAEFNPPDIVAPPVPKVVIPPLAFDWKAWEKAFEADMADARAMLEADQKKLDALIAESKRRGDFKAHKLPEALLEQQREISPAEADQLGKDARKQANAERPDGPRQFAAAPDSGDAAQEAEFAKGVKDIDEVEAMELPPAEESTGDAVWTRESCEAHAAKGKGFAGQDLSGLDLSGLKLTGLDFKEAILKATNFSSCDLTGSCFDGATLAGANLSGACLARSRAVGADLTGVSAPEADLSEADLTGSDLSRSDFKKCSGKGLIANDAVCVATDFSTAVLEGALFRDGVMDEVILTRADLRNSDFSRTIASNSSGSEAVFEGAILDNFRAGRSDYAGARFKGIKAPGSIWESAVLDGADFRHADLKQSSFLDASLIKANLSQADMSTARLTEAVLEETLMIKTNLFRSSFEEARIIRADMRGANLYEAEFLDAVIEKADLTLANRKGTKIA